MLRDKLLGVYANFDMETYLTLKESLGDVDESICHDQLAELPKIYANYAALCNLAENEYIKAEDDLIVWQSEARFNYAEEREKEKKKVTAVILDDYIQSRPEFVKLKANVREAKQRWKQFKALIRCLEVKRDALIQTCSTKRAEARIIQ